MQPGEPTFHLSVAGQQETGRACPYCRFPLKESVQIAVCTLCGAPHHADCWHDNRGCAVIACAGGPSVATAGHTGEATAAQTAPHQATAEQGAWSSAATATPRWGPQPPFPGRWSPSLAVAVIVLAVAVAGAAVAIGLSGQGVKGARPAVNTIALQTVTTSSTPANASTASSPVQSTAESGSTTAPESGSTTAAGQGLIPAVPAQQMQSEIQHMLLEWHEDVVQGSFNAAWALLSHRKQVQDSSEYGYPQWVKNQATLRPYLDPSGLRVSIQHTEPSSGVAQVDLTGMSWNKPRSSCTEWSGITWVKYEDGAWRYDPGYSTTPQREREWKPRFSELLGGRC